jgi:hypothetical protein
VSVTALEDLSGGLRHLMVHADALGLTHEIPVGGLDDKVGARAHHHVDIGVPRRQ